MAPEHHRLDPCPFDLQDSAGRHTACLTGGCVWTRLARMEDQTDGFSPIDRLLHAYYLDLAGLCRCPHGRGRAI